METLEVEVEEVVSLSITQQILGAVGSLPKLMAELLAEKLVVKEQSLTLQFQKLI